MKNLLLAVALVLPACLSAEEAPEVDSQEQALTYIAECARGDAQHFDAYDIFKNTTEILHGQPLKLLSGPFAPAQPGDFIQQKWSAPAPYGQRGTFQYWSTGAVRRFDNWKVTAFSATLFFQTQLGVTFKKYGTISCDCSRPRGEVCKYDKLPVGW